MSTEKFTKMKLLLSFTAFSLLAGYQSNTEATDLPLSVIYGGVEDRKKSLFLSDEEGKRRVKVVSATLSDGYPAVSPSGKTIAFYGKYDKYKTWSIHIVDADGKNVRRLTHVKDVWDSSPAWSPDGKTIAFAREYKDENGSMHEEVWLMNADGSEKRQIKAIKGRSPEFMSDGRLLFQSKASPSQISIANIDGSNIVQLTDDETNNMSPKISPDGTQIAYLSNRDGNQEVYVMDLDGSNQNRITRNYITEWGPSWSTDGSSVLFSSQNVHGFYDIFKAKTDGTSIKKILSNGSQSATVFSLDKAYLGRLLNKKN